MVTYHAPIYLLLGSNQGNRAAYLELTACHISKRIGRITKKSSLYKTAAWGVTEQSDFLNQALEISTAYNPEELLGLILQIEKDIGRVRQEKWGERVIDIDILYYKNLVIDTELLKTPHPEIANRKFALCPMAEMAPSFIHPVLKLSQQALLDRCQDILSVKLFTS